MAEPSMEPVYPWGHPGQAIELLQSPATLAGEGAIGSVRVWVTMTRGVEVRWRVTDDNNRHLSLGPSQLTLHHPTFGDVRMPVEVNNSDGRGYLSSETTFGPADNIERVIVHWINVPEIPFGAPLESKQGTWAGRWTVDVAGWTLTLDSRFNLSMVLLNARDEDEQFIMTHVGEVRRTDGTSFDSKTATDVLFAWQVAMSFALSRWVAPAVPIGFDRSGQRAWEQWASWRCDTFQGYETWWDQRRQDDLADFTKQFIAAFLNDGVRPVVRHLAFHAITANHAGTTTEAKVMLAQAGLEYLAWVDLVLNGMMSRKKFRDLRAEERLQRVVTNAQISTALPDDLDALNTLMDSEDGDLPAAVTRLRNRLVHPKDPSEPYWIEGLVWQASRLLLEWLELCLLHRIGYMGRYQRRYPPRRSAFINAQVPWSECAD